MWQAPCTICWFTNHDLKNKWANITRYLWAIALPWWWYLWSLNHFARSIYHSTGVHRVGHSLTAWLFQTVCDRVWLYWWSWSTEQTRLTTTSLQLSLSLWHPWEVSQQLNPALQWPVNNWLLWVSWTVTILLNAIYDHTAPINNRYFEEPWACAVFHDRFSDFVEEVREYLGQLPTEVSIMLTQQYSWCEDSCTVGLGWKWWKSWRLCQRFGWRRSSLSSYHPPSFTPNQVWKLSRQKTNPPTSI